MYEGVQSRAGASVDVEVDEDLAVLAHWLLTRVSTLRGVTDLCNGDSQLSDDERRFWLERAGRLGDEVESVLGNLARGIPAGLAGLPYAP
jgi:hypothetical protein